MVLGCVNRTAWGTKLLLMAVLASLVDCISSGHLLKVQHYNLSPNKNEHKRKKLGSAKKHNGQILDHNRHMPIQ